MKRDEAAYLLDMLLAAKDALEFSSGLTFQQFTRNRLHQNAIFKSIEIIGEAATHIGEKTKQQNPKIPMARYYRHSKPSCSWVFSDKLGTHPLLRIHTLFPILACISHKEV